MIPYGRQYIDESDIDAVVSTLKSGWLTCGPMVDKFEESLAKVISAKYVISCSNGTTALHLAMLGCSIGSGDVVLVPAITFLASANAARYVGADVVFVDVDPETGLMTAETLDKAISENKDKNLRAVVNVHLNGQCADIAELSQVARKNNLLIIEDAAHALGTSFIDQNATEYSIGANSFSDITTFSFHPVKTIAMGEGGAVSTNNESYAKKMRMLRSHGMRRDVSSEPWYYEMHEVGFNYRISDINCALGLSQLDKLSMFKQARSRLVDIYDESFSNMQQIRPIKKLIHSKTAWHLNVVLIDFVNLNISRSELMLLLKNEGIGTQVHYIPLYKQPYYKELYGDQLLPGAEKYYAQALSLPLFYDLTEQDQLHVINTLINYVK